MLRPCVGKWLFEIYFFILKMLYFCGIFWYLTYKPIQVFCMGFLASCPKMFILTFSTLFNPDPQFFGTFTKFTVTFEWMVQSFKFKKVKVSEFNGESVENIWKCLKSTENTGAIFQC